MSCVHVLNTKREIRHLHVVVVQRRQRNVQKSVMHVQSCSCFASLNLLLFLPFSLPSPSSFLKLPNIYSGESESFQIEAETCLSVERTTLRKQPTFRDATTGFFLETKSEKRLQKWSEMTRLYPALSSASHCLKWNDQSEQMWVMTRHQYGISVLVPQTSFRRKKRW